MWKITVLLPSGMSTSAWKRRARSLEACCGGGGERCVRDTVGRRLCKEWAYFWVCTTVWFCCLIQWTETACSTSTRYRTICTWPLSIWVGGNTHEQPPLMRYWSANLQKQTRNSNWQRNSPRLNSSSWHELKSCLLFGNGFDTHVLHLIHWVYSSCFQCEEMETYP